MATFDPSKKNNKRTIIRRARIGDVGALAPLFDAYRQFYQKPGDVKGAGRFLRERLTKKDSVVFLASDDAGTVHGFVQLYPTLSSVSMQRLWILNDLFVSSSARRSGVAEALIERSIQHARETRSKGLILETAIDNIPARTLYEKLGWKRDDEFHRYSITFERK